jgi:hypothetical protein
MSGDSDNRVDPNGDVPSEIEIGAGRGHEDDLIWMLGYEMATSGHPLHDLQCLGEYADDYRDGWETGVIAKRKEAER